MCQTQKRVSDNSSAVHPGTESTCARRLANGQEGSSPLLSVSRARYGKAEPSKRAGCLTGHDGFGDYQFSSGFVERGGIAACARPAAVPPDALASSIATA